MFTYAFTRAVRNFSQVIIMAALLCQSWVAAEDKKSTDDYGDSQPAKATDSKLSLTARQVRGATPFVPVADEPPAKIFIDPLTPSFLARGRVVVQFRTENLRLFPIFGSEALKVSPRIGHLFVRLDDSPWTWAHSCGDDLTVNRLAAGPHKIQLELASPNHEILTTGLVQFEIPPGPHMTTSPKEHEIVSDANSKREPPAQFIVDPLPSEGLAQGVAYFTWHTKNAYIASVYGPDATTISPRICHLHVTVDDARWRWAHTNDGPVILAGLPSGPHKVLLELVNANHQPLVAREFKFETGQPAATRLEK